MTIALASTNAGEGTVSPGSLSFDASNWSQPRLVTVTGVDDAVADGNAAFSVVFGSAVSADPAYSGFNVSPVSVTNLDND